MVMSFEGKEIMLGSGSPRRREILGMMDIPFEVVHLCDIDEKYPPETPAEKVPEYLSRLKAEGHRNEIYGDRVLITADTVVILGDEILGKPSDKADAISMLRRLSGRTHKVVTGVTLTSASGCETFSETTEVMFADLSDGEIERYVEKYKPYDKAGAYGIQEWIGAVGIKGINGCYYNVMGLPSQALYRRLIDFCTR